jgi:hypothetical protein
MLGQNLVVRDVNHGVVVDIACPIPRNQINPDLGDLGGLTPCRSPGARVVRSTRAEQSESEADGRSHCRDRIAPLIRCLGSEDPERGPRDEKALKGSRCCGRSRASWSALARVGAHTDREDAAGVSDSLVLTCRREGLS